MTIDIQNDLSELETIAKSPRQLALLRIAELQNQGDEGLACKVVTSLTQAVDAWLSSQQQERTMSLRRLLNLLLDLVQTDSTLAEELARQGSHGQLLRLLSGPVVTEELQDLACQIGAEDPKFPRKVLPFSVTELRTRLPLVFTLDKSLDILIHQVTARQSAQEDVGFVLWPSSVLLARWLVQNPTFLRGERILELGSGCGLVGLAAAGILRSQSPPTPTQVILTDFQPTVLDNLVGSVRLNHLSSTECTVRGLDFCRSSGPDPTTWIDLRGLPQPPVDVVLAADIICQASDAHGAAHAIRTVLRPGGCAVVVCAGPMHRFGVEHFSEACRREGLEVEERTIQEGNDDDGLLVEGDLRQTSGYVPGMTFSFFTIRKPAL